MKENRMLTVREIQQTELGILRSVRDFCEKEGLRYFLAGGTLLGAVRHKGFIPWDNDIDIAMPRPDYEMFIERFKAQGPYRVMKPENDNDYIYPFIKVVDTRTRLVERAVGMKISGLGLYIDIFPVDGFGDDERQAKELILKAYREGYHIAYTAGKDAGLSFVQKVMRTVRKVRYAAFGGRERSFEKLKKRLQSNPFDSSAFVGSTYGLRVERELIKREAFACTVPVRFEDGMYAAPSGWDEYLTNMYGDYMKLPPENERVANHDMDARFVEEPQC